MKNLTAALAALLAGLAVAAPTASADELPDLNGWTHRAQSPAVAISDPGLALDLRVAAAYYGETVRDIQIFGYRPQAAGAVTGMPVDGFAVSPSHIWLNLELLAGDGAAPNNVPMTGRQMCSLMSHEVGHLVGLTHSDAYGPRDPFGAMGDRSRTPDPRLCPKRLYRHTGRSDGRPRSINRRADRKWCRRHAPACVNAHRKLSFASLEPVAWDEANRAQDVPREPS